MHRFYIKEINEDDPAIADPDQIHHVRDVLRLKAGDELTVFDEKGQEYLCAISTIEKKRIGLAMKGKRLAGAKAVKLTIACALPKKTSMDDVVDGLTQLGVDAIIPMETDRVIVKLDQARKEARLKRWQKIAESAAKQSQRSSVPQIDPVTEFKDVIARAADFDLKLIPTLPGEKNHIREVLAAAKPKNVLVLIGPEGDFTPEEIEFAQNAGFVPVSLGDTVLRVGIAAIAVASYLRFSLA